MMARGWRGARLLATLLVVAGMLGGCQILYFIFGQGDQPALYRFGKGKRVLVLVEAANGVTVPPAFTTSLADQIGLHLQRYKAVDVPLVPQERLIALQQANPEKYPTWGVPDIARRTDADLVLYVAITQMAINKTADGTVGEGRAMAYVKVCNQKEKLWPADDMGQLVEARQDAVLLRDKSDDDIRKDMAERLTLRTGRMFHAYSLDNQDMAR
jgi:hypothetical protein